VITSIFFCAGLGLGFTLGLATWAFCSWFGKKIASQEFQKVVVKAKAEQMMQDKRVKEAMAKVRAQYPEMDEDQVRIAESELSKANVFGSRQKQ
jgi:hypothetical protein